MNNSRMNLTPVEDKNGQIILGDCREVLSRESFPLVDLVHTSPPYNIDKPYEGFTDKLHLNDYFEFVSQVAHLLSKKMRVGGSLFWQTGYTQSSPNSDEINPIDMLVLPFFKEHGFYLKDRIIWRYFGGMSFKSKFKNQHETILWLVKGDPDSAASRPYFNVDEVRETSREHDPRNNLLGRNPGNVWEVDRVAYGSIEQTTHIAVFPEQITERIIRACSKPGDLVLDPFLGSGTVAKVARSLGRKYVGIEISSSYYRESVERLGYQQFGEVDTLLSDLLKKFVAAKGFRATKKDCAFYFEQLCKAKPSALEDRLSGWCSSFTGVNDVEKKKKQELWRMGDEFIESLHSHPTTAPSMLSHIANAYLNSYKLARDFNGLKIGLIAYRLKQEIEPHLKRARKIETVIDRLVKSEPSSFDTRSRKDSISLRKSDRRVKKRVSRRKPQNRATVNDSVLF